MTVNLSYYILQFFKNPLELKYLVHKISLWCPHDISLSKANVNNVSLFLTQYEPKLS